MPLPLWLTWLMPGIALLLCLTTVNRVRAGLDYSDVFAGVNLTPNLAWSHDVSGTSPAPNFIEDRKALSIGLRADYLNTYQAEISYTNFFGADYNEQEDRDFLSLSFSVAF